MNLMRTETELRKKSAESRKVEVLFNPDDAVRKVGKPSCSEKWKDREAVIAREMQHQGFSQAQIAEYLGCSVSTVKRRLDRK